MTPMYLIQYRQRTSTILVALIVLGLSPNCTAADEIERLQRECDAKQACIDELMLEYCPDEMTSEQIDEWEAHQRVVEPPNAALSSGGPTEQQEQPAVSPPSA